MITKPLSLVDIKHIGEMSVYPVPFDAPPARNIAVPEAIYQTLPANRDRPLAPVRRDTAVQHKSKIKKALKYINGRLTRNLSLDEVADHVDLSPCYFSKLFKQQQGVGFNVYVNRQRMKQAQLLLDMPELSIATVAKNLGFSQTSYFCRLFRQIYQITPQTYRSRKSTQS